MDASDLKLLPCWTSATIGNGMAVKTARPVAILVTVASQRDDVVVVWKLIGWPGEQRERGGKTISLLMGGRAGVP